MRTTLYQWILRFIGVRGLYDEVVGQDRCTNVRAGIRRDLVELLTTLDSSNPFFEGKFTRFLADNGDVSDEQFFAAYAGLPVMTKTDYAGAGRDVMRASLASSEAGEVELRVDGNPLDSLRRLRHGRFLMPMATGGSTSLPLTVHMTKHHMFSMLFTFFKCWRRMGWTLGERMLIFYPRNTYNIDDMVKFNRYSWLLGFRYHLFDRIDEQVVRDLVDDINRYKPKLLLVFPSPMNMVAHTIRRLGLKLRHQPPLINVGGETFFDCQRRNIESVFPRSKVEDSYGSVELGEIAHETDGGLEVFSDVAYVETEPNSAGKSEMVVTRLKLADFPFVRYKMRDIADLELRLRDDGTEQYVMTRIEGKDTNHIVSEQGQRFYPSFFNDLVNELNAQYDDCIQEVKVYERGQVEMEVHFILRSDGARASIEAQTVRLLRKSMGDGMKYRVRFVDFIDHDYRRKYRVIERVGDVEFAGGLVGDERKAAMVARVKSETC